MIKVIRTLLSGIVFNEGFNHFLKENYGIGIFSMIAGLAFACMQAKLSLQYYRYEYERGYFDGKNSNRKL